jgi:hypothetical protein
MKGLSVWSACGTTIAVLLPAEEATNDE